MLSDTCDDLTREVYGIFGIPVDAADEGVVLERVRGAASARRPLLLSTPNLNFLIQSLSDTPFRESLLRSDLCCADGMPIVWLARLLGAPIRERVAGSDMFEALKAPTATSPLKVFLFGGPEGVAEKACAALNAAPGGIVCVGWLYPGFGGLESMSTNDVIATINASKADFLFVSLGAQKGQAWLLRNHARLEIPVRVHLGATINFQSGDVQRAPQGLRKAGLEWLWRIAQEPYLWRRYWHDGRKLIELTLTRALPLVVGAMIARIRGKEDKLEVACRRDHGNVRVSLSGDATASNVDQAIATFREAIEAGRPVVIDMALTRIIDSRFTGLLLMVRKLAERSGGVRIVNAPRRIAKMLSLNGFAYLLEPGRA
jgi:N-acetylglucosaminyldiphosphoundecaprenol N-acetyl-beta-D-mannosaminyltransferase